MSSVLLLMLPLLPRSSLFPYTTLFRSTPTFFERYRTGDLMARSTNDLKAISLTAGFGILTLVDSTTFMLMIVAMMGFTISWKLTLAALIPLPFMAVLMNYRSEERRVGKEYRNTVVAGN